MNARPDCPKCCRRDECRWLFVLVFSKTPDSGVLLSERRHMGCFGSRQPLCLTRPRSGQEGHGHTESKFSHGTRYYGRLAVQIEDSSTSSTTTEDSSARQKVEIRTLGVVEPHLFAFFLDLLSLHVSEVGAGHAGFSLVEANSSSAAWLVWIWIRNVFIRWWRSLRGFACLRL